MRVLRPSITRAGGRLLTPGIAFVMLVFPATARATDFPVATPAEIVKAAARARPGDTITMRDGDWRDADILFEADGAPDRPIVLRAATAGKVVVSGKSRLRIAGSHLVVTGLFFDRAYHSDDLIAFRRDSRRLARHCRLTNCAVVDCNGFGKETSTRWISLYGDHHRVDHCLVQGKKTKGTTLVVWLAGVPNEHRIDHNHFGPRPELKANGGETIRVGDSSTSMTVSRTLVEENCFEECNGEAEIVSNKSCENVYRSNTFLRCSGALTLRHGDRCLVEGNFFLGQKARGTGGVRIIGEGHRVLNNYFAELEGKEARAALSFVNGLADSPANGYFAAKGAVVAFNSIVDCKQPLVIGLSDKDTGNAIPPSDCTVANNLVVGSRPPLDLRTVPTDFRWQGNLFSKGPSGFADLAGVRVVNVPMRRDERGLWRPEATSPVVGAAEGDFPFVIDDIDGQLRGEHKDVGCDQVSSDKTLRRPLMPGDVGPEWTMRGQVRPIDP